MKLPGNSGVSCMALVRECLIYSFHECWACSAASTYQLRSVGSPGMAFACDSELVVVFVAVFECVVWSVTMPCLRYCVEHFARVWILEEYEISRWNLRLG